MPQIFLSYSRLDEKFAKRLFSDLRNRGLEVWFDQESLLAGQDWKAEIEKAINDSDFVALLLSNNSMSKRGYFQKEVRLTLDVLQTVPFGHIYILPVRLDDCRAPAPLASLQYVDLFPNWESGIEKLLKSIHLQGTIQSNARIAEKAMSSEEPKILLVNDEPASMNLMIDIWKTNGFRVEYAFDVRGAISAIQKESPSVVVSDLSHFSFGRLITDRAAFEILEWVKSNNLNTNIIITTSNLTDQRRKEAISLGADGICNTIPELNSLISKITGRSVNLPEGVFFSNDSSESVGSPSRMRADDSSLATLTGESSGPILKKAALIIHRTAVTAAASDVARVSMYFSDSRPSSHRKILVSMIRQLGELFGKKCEEASLWAVCNEDLDMVILNLGMGLSLPPLISLLPPMGNVVGAQTTFGVSKAIGWGAYKAFEEGRDITTLSPEEWGRYISSGKAMDKPDIKALLKQRPPHERSEYEAIAKPLDSSDVAAQESKSERMDSDQGPGSGHEQADNPL